MADGPSPTWEASGSRPNGEPLRRGLLGDSATISVAAFLSRVTGLLRVIAIAAVLGPTVLGDLFVAVNVLPLMLYDVFAGSAITSVLVPPLVRLVDSGAIRKARQLVGNALGLILVAMAVIAGLAVLGRHVIAGVLTSGVDRAMAGDAKTVAALLVVLIVPQLVLYAAIGVFVSIQHARQRFVLPSAAPVIENIALICTVAIVGQRFSEGGSVSGHEVGSVPTGLVIMLGVGSGLAVSAHAVVQFIGARRSLGPTPPGFGWREPDIRALAGPTCDSFSWSSVIALRHFALVVAAAYAGPGGVQAFEIATLAYFVPLALVGRAVASAALPRLALASGTEATGHTYLGAVRVAAWLAVPAGLALIVLREPLAVIASRGEFASPEAMKLVAFGLAGLGIGAASDALFEVARQATMATPNRATIRHSTLARAAVTIVGLPVAVLAFDGARVLLGLGLVVSLGDLAAFVIVHRGARLRPTARKTVRHWPRIALASAIAFGLAAAATRALGSRGLVESIVLSAGVVTAYAAAAWVLTERGRLIVDLVRPLDTGADR